MKSFRSMLQTAAILKRDGSNQVPPTLITEMQRVSFSSCISVVFFWKRHVWGSKVFVGQSKADTKEEVKNQVYLWVVGAHLAAGLHGPTSPLPGSFRQAGPPHPSSAPPRCQHGWLFVISDLQAGTTLHRSPFGGSGRVVGGWGRRGLANMLVVNILLGNSVNRFEPALCPECEATPWQESWRSGV